ncbi:hypothetical protein AHFPHNDE_01844 [Pseudomonas sp. MM227]|uniref:DUF4214 domain-containing protein n=1 Tax=Pseudomonas sp. MM227 TaxID=3019968 RepID=UPI0022208561|nr:DUF4214 domain-containing protein [Pseudomonas sp. MM227]CAI3788171.1 hypothetical protein AHFPHNDE_01844 [Pseudomonas sp. MM227]
MQYDQPYSATELKGSLANNPTLLSSTTAAAISTLLALDTAATVSVASWDGLSAPVSPVGTTAQLVTAEIAGAAGDNVALAIPAELSAAQAFIFDSEANLVVSFDTPAPVATFAALAEGEVAATAATESTPDLIVTSGDGNDTLIFTGDQNVYVDGREGDDVIITAAGNDTIYGGAGNNVIISGAGDDQIFLAGTSDVVNAGEGYDVVTLQGSRAAYDFVAGNNFNVDGTGAQTASITNAEFLAFDNEESIALATSEDQAAALRLYQGILGRDADAAGAKVWAGAADQGVATGSIAQSFLDSFEFKADASEAFVTSLYQNLLERTAPEATDVEYWSNVLASGASRADVATTFALSPDAITVDQSNSEYVESLYQSALGRDSDAEGLNSWVTALFNGASRGDIAQSIVNSAEAATKVNADFIDTLYSNALDRPADTEGKAFWVDSLAQGVTQAEVAVAIVGSPEAAENIDNVIVIHGQV